MPGAGLVATRRSRSDERARRVARGSPARPCRLLARCTDHFASPALEISTRGTKKIAAVCAGCRKRGRVAGSYAAFAHRDFRLFQGARFAGAIANQIQGVAIAAHLYERTGHLLDL